MIVQEQKPTEYTYVVSVNPPRGRFRFGRKEVEHLMLATVLVVGVGLSLYMGSESLNYVLLAFSTVAFTVSFLLHEIAHKIVAQKNGLWAEFRIIAMGAVLTAVSIFLPLKFISPGAVMVAGSADRKTMGRTAIAGPITNIILSTGFSTVAAGLMLTGYSQIYVDSFGVIAWFNAWIAVFNLIPFAILDGLKVFSWNKAAWALVFAVSAALTVVLTLTFLV